MSASLALCYLVLPLLRLCVLTADQTFRPVVNARSRWLDGNMLRRLFERCVSGDVPLSAKHTSSSLETENEERTGQEKANSTERATALKVQNMRTGNPDSRPDNR